MPQVKKHLEAGGAEIAPDELRASALEYTRRLAVKMTVDGLPKVTYVPAPGAWMFGDADEWGQFFAEGNARLAAVRAAAPLRRTHAVH